MTGVPRSRPAKQPNWRPSDRRDAHPLRRWFVRFAWTFGAVALVIVFIILLNWTVEGERVAFVSLTIENYDPGELPPPAFANADRASLSILPWTDTSTPKLSNPERAASALSNWQAPPELDTLICYISSHVAVRPYDEKENRVCLIAPDFRRAELADFLVPGDNGAAVDVRDLLQAMKQVPAEAKLLVIDSPRAHAEPWLAALGRNWTDTLAADVKAAEDPALWVIVPGESDTVSRVNHQARDSQFSKAITDVLTANGGNAGPLDLATLVAQLTKATGQAPLVLHTGQSDDNPQFLQVRFSRPSAATNTAANEAPATEKKSPDAPAKEGKDATPSPPDPVLLAWQASDELLDVEQNKSSIGPIDYAPDLWRKLQSIMVWHDWAAHTGWTPPDDDTAHDPFADLIAAKPLLALAPEPAGSTPRHAAIRPLLDAANQFAAEKKACEQSPPGYRLAVRRRNLLAARVPDYWRWKAVCGGFDPVKAKADLAIIRELSNRIAKVAQEGDSGTAGELEKWDDRDPAQQLFLRVTKDFSNAEVTPLCNRKATPGKAPSLDGATQFAIEQLLLSSLPSAKDRERLWTTLHESDFTPGQMKRTNQIVSAQAQCEAMLVTLETELAESLNVLDAERLGELAAAVKDAAEGLGDGKNAAGAVDFARQLGAYSELLASVASRAPDSAAAELFVRFADPLVPRAPNSETLAALPVWKSPLEAVYPGKIELTQSTEAKINVTLRGAGEGKTPTFQFKSIPAGLAVEHNGKALQERVPITAEQFEFKISADRNIISGQDAVLTGEAWIAGTSEKKPVTITVALPSDSQFEIVSLGKTGLVERKTSAGAPQLVLLAFPQEATEFALGVKQNSGPDTTLNASLYELEKDPSNAPLPKTFEALQSAARKLDVQVEVGAKSATKVSPLKFLPAAPPTPPSAAAPTSAAPPPPAAAGEIPLETKYLALVLEESNPANPAAAIQHVLWMAIEPLHPDHYVAIPVPKPDFDGARKRFQIPIRAKTSIEGDVAIPSGGVPVTLGGSDVFHDANRVNGEGVLTATHSINARIDFPEEGADLTDARLFLDVGGYPRAFMWSVEDSGSIALFHGSRIAIKTPQRPEPDDPPLARRPNEPIDVAFEADCDDQDCQVELQLRLFEGDGDDDIGQFSLAEKPPRVIIQRDWNGTRQFGNYVKPTETGLLAVGCNVSDFTERLLPGDSRGRGEIVARIVDPNRPADSLAEDRLPILFDGAPPTVLTESLEATLEHFVDKDLIVPVRVTDRLSGPHTLHYWLEEPSMNAGVADPPGKKATLDPRITEAGGFRDRVFTIPMKELPPSPPAGVGVARIYLLATDRAGNAMEEPEPFDVGYETVSMDQAGSGKGKPRDVIVKVQYIRGTRPVDSSGAQVEIVSAGERQGEKKAAGANGATFEQLPPGTYQFKATGNMANAPGVKEMPITVPDSGEGPIQKTITLEAVPPPPPPPPKP